MGKYVLQKTFYVLLTLVLISRCGTVPIRSRRQVQDLPLLHEDYDDDDNDDNGDGPIVDDDTSQLSPLDDIRPDHLQGNIEYADHFHSNISGINDNDNDEMSETGVEGDIRDLNLDHDQIQHHAEPTINDDGHLNEHYPDRESYVTGQVNLQGQGHLPSSRQNDLNQSSVSQGHGNTIGTTKRTTDRENFVINAVGRAMNIVNVSTSEERQTQHGFLMGGNVNVNTSEEHRTYSGFLMGGNVQNTENDNSALTTSTLTSTSLTPLQTTTTREPFITVRLSDIYSHEWTESTAHEHVPNNDIIIDRTDHNSPGRSDRVPGSVDRPGQSHDEDKSVTTEMPFTGEGQIATLPGEPNMQGQGNENGENLNGNGETEGNENGIDVPIDKGENPHDRHNEGHNSPGLPRHTNNPIVQTVNRNENLPVTEPVLTTPELIILPTPANLEPEEKNTTAGIQEPQPSVRIHGGENENSGLINYTEEIPLTTGEGHIEFITELPEIHGGLETKPNKMWPKHEKISQTLSSELPYSFEYRPIETEEYHPRSITADLFSSFSTYSSSKSSDLNVQTTVPETLQSSTIDKTVDNKIFSTVKPCLESEYQTCQPRSPSTSAPGGSPHSSHLVIPLEHSEVYKSSTPSLPYTSSASLLQSISSVQHEDILSSSTEFSSKTTVPHEVHPSSMDIFTTTLSNQNIMSTALESSIAEPVTPDLPTRTIDQFSDIIRTIHSDEVWNEESSVTSMVTSQILATPALSEVIHPSTELGLSAASSFAPLQSSSDLISQSFTPATSVTQPTQASVTFPMLTSNPTTKKKEDHSSTRLTPTIHTTQKKPHSEKEPDKPETQSSSTSSSVGTPTTSQMIITTTLPPPLQTTTTQKIELSTTSPSVYIEIKLRMDWSQFCTTKSTFISEITGIIHSQKGYIIDEEQFILSTGACANNLLMDVDHIQTITIEMYIVGNDGKLDILLTTETSVVISKEFQQSNYLKDKIVYVHTVNRKRPETLPESRPERRSERPSVTMVIALASMGGVCCLVLIILQVLIHRRVKAKRKQRQFIGHRASLQSMDHVALGVIPKSRPSSGYWNPALDDTMELPEPEEHSHILNFSGLANFCMDTKAIYAECQTIPFDNVNLTSIPVGEEDKNRFANVLPHKHSRVSLNKTQDNKSGYINANYVNGYMGEKRVYIATQSPLVNTVDDFWRMVWEQQTRTVLMLNPMTQQGKPKQSTCYWPDNLETDCRREFEDFIVTLKKRDVQHDYVDCTLEIMDIERNLKREIHHFWFTCWSDTGPPEPLTFVKFVLDTRPHYENSGAPAVVHCGPGTGRTGTFIAVDMCMRMFEDRRRVDIQSCVHKMRGERAGSVQTKEQYNLVYQALNEYAVILSSPSISTRSSVITLHAML